MIQNESYKDHINEAIANTKEDGISTLKKVCMLICVWVIYVIQNVECVIPGQVNPMGRRMEFKNII